MIATETPTWEDSPTMPKSNYRASGLVHRPKAVVRLGTAMATDRMPIDFACQILLGMTTCLVEAIISL